MPLRSDRSSTRGLRALYNGRRARRVAPEHVRKLMRILWDQAAAEAMGWDPEQLARLRELLNNEPHVRGRGYNQYADEIVDIEGMEAYPDDEIAGED